MDHEERLQVATRALCLPHNRGSETSVASGKGERESSVDARRFLKGFETTVTNSSSVKDLRGSCAKGSRPSKDGTRAEEGRGGASWCRLTVEPSELIEAESSLRFQSLSTWVGSSDDGSSTGEYRGAWERRGSRTSGARDKRQGKHFSPRYASRNFDVRRELSGERREKQGADFPFSRHRL